MDTDERDPGSTRSGDEEVRDRFEQGRDDVDREDLREVMDGFEEKLNRVKQSAGPQFVRRALGHAKLFYRLLEAWWRGHYSVPWKTISAVGAVLLYFINPFDLSPDFIPVVGLMDDATMIYLGFSFVQEDLIEFARDRDLDVKSYGIDPDHPRPPVSQ